MVHIAGCWSKPKCLEGNGGQVRYFFRSYNVPEEIADKFFDFLDEET